jgi:hypothetical protein
MEFDKDPIKARAAFTQFVEVADGDDPRRKDATERLKDLEKSGKRSEVHKP